MVLCINGHVFVMSMAFIMFFSLTHSLPFDYLSHVLLYDARVLIQNQDQDIRRPLSRLADLFWTF